MTTFLLILCGLVVLLILYKVFTAPMRFLLKLALNTLLGFIALILLNTLGAGIGVALGVNWVNACLIYTSFCVPPVRVTVSFATPSALSTVTCVSAKPSSLGSGASLSLTTIANVLAVS